MYIIQIDIYIFLAKRHTLAEDGHITTRLCNHSGSDLLPVGDIHATDMYADLHEGSTQVWHQISTNEHFSLYNIPLVISFERKQNIRFQFVI